MIHETDHDFLSDYLDDALAPDEARAVEQRVALDPAFALALQQLRRERATRVAAFEQLAPPSDEARRFADRVIVSLRRRSAWASARRAAGMIAAAAACLLAGFAFGRMRPSPRTAALPAPARLVVHAPAAAGQYQVAIFDDNGTVIGLQQFTSLEDAREFADDLAQYQLRRQQVSEGHATVISDQF